MRSREEQEPETSMPIEKGKTEPSGECRQCARAAWQGSSEDAKILWTRHG